MLGRGWEGRKGGGQRSEAFSGHPRGTSHPPSAGRGSTWWEGTLGDYQGEGIPNTAATPFISLLVICQAGQGHAAAISQKPGQNHEVGVRPRTPTQRGPSGRSVLMGVLVCLTCFFPMLSGEVEGNEGGGRCGHRTQREWDLGWVEPSPEEQGALGQQSKGSGSCPSGQDLGIIDDSS